MKKTFSYLQIAIAEKWQDWGSASIRCDGWSGYFTRLKMAREGIILYEEVYGIEQARQHIEEIRNTKGEYAEYWQTVGLRIERVTTTTEVL